MTNLTCQSGVELLMDYLEGHATADQRAAIEQHVQVCPRCLAFIASYQETPRILRKATECELPGDLRAALWSVLRRQRRGTS